MIFLLELIIGLLFKVPLFILSVVFTALFALLSLVVEVAAALLFCVYYVVLELPILIVFFVGSAAWSFAVGTYEFVKFFGFVTGIILWIGFVWVFYRQVVEIKVSRKRYVEIKQYLKENYTFYSVCEYYHEMVGNQPDVKVTVRFLLPSSALIFKLTV